MNREKMLKITRKVSNHSIDSKKVNDLVDYAKKLNVRIVEFDKKHELPCGIGKVCIPDGQTVVVGEILNVPKLMVTVEAVRPGMASVENNEVIAVRGVTVR